MDETGGTSMTDENESRFCTQDGIECPKRAPWPGWVSAATGAAFLPMTVLAVAMLWQSPSKLAIWLLGFGLFLVPLRYLICARCPYYGQSCSSPMGKTVPFIFKKQEGRSMKAGLWLDVAAFAFLFLFPLPDAFAWRGIGGLFLWISSWFLIFVLLTGLACSRCPFVFCPIGRAGRAFFGLFAKPGRDK